MDPFTRSKTLKYYKRLDVQNALLDAAFDREIAISYGGKGYGKRPDTLTFPNDILSFAKNGSTSFHCSEEIWRNPLAIRTGMSRKESDEMRKGWDLVLDIDCPELEYARVCAIVLIDAIKHHGVNAVFVKFSGNNGFHIAIPFEAFPKVINGEALAKMFPEGPRKVALYLQEFMRDALKKKLLEKYEISDMAKRLNKSFDELVKDKVFDPYEVMKIDTVLISSRHLYRMPYSMHEKSGLVSIPLTHDELETFDRSWAETEKVDASRKFLDMSKVVAGEASRLLVEAFDFVPPEQKDQRYNSTIKKEYIVPTEAVPEDLFPPCIRHILSGLEDGKKRSMFILTYFLKSLGWDHDKLEERMRLWNEVNPEPIREVILKSHLRHHKGNKGMPPSCSNKAYYKDLGVCHPDNLCSKIKNPVSYSKRKAWALSQNAPKKRVKKVDLRFDSVDENDQVIGKVTSKEIEKDKLNHRIVQVLILDQKESRIFLRDQEGVPFISAEGLVREAEPLEQAAARVLDKELELRVVIQKMSSFVIEKEDQKIFVTLFIGYAPRSYAGQGKGKFVPVSVLAELIDKGLGGLHLDHPLRWLLSNKEKLFNE